MATEGRSSSFCRSPGGEARSWSELRLDLDKPTAYEVICASGLVCQFQIEVFWDDDRSLTLRVMITSDDSKGWRILGRMRSNDFIKAPPDGTVVGEDMDERQVAVATLRARASSCGTAEECASRTLCTLSNSSREMSDGWMPLQQLTRAGYLHGEA